MKARGAQALAKYLPSWQFLVMLRYGPYGRRRLLWSGLAQRKHRPSRMLVRASVESDELGDAGVTALAKGVEGLLSLLLLRCERAQRHWPKRAPRGADWTAVTVKSLVPHRLSNVRMKDAGASALAAALPSLYTIKTLQYAYSCASVHPSCAG